MKPLTAKEKLFCAYYCLDRNGREAAAKSGYKLASNAAEKLLKKENIKAQIEKTDAERKNRGADISAGYYRLAFGCVSDAVSLLFEDNVTKPLIEKMDLFNISEIKRQKNGTVEIKFFDRLKALEKLEQSCFDESAQGMNTLYGAIEKGAAALRYSDEQD